MGGSSGAMGQLGAKMDTPQSGQGAQYTPAQTQSPYQSSQTPSQAMSPFARQMANKQSSQFEQAGLEAIMSGFMQSNPSMAQFMYNPAQQQTAMPQYGTQGGDALAYRPDMTQANALLSKVKPSVYKTELDAAKERIAQYEAEAAARTQAEQDSGYNYG